MANNPALTQEAIGARIAGARDDAGFTQAELGGRIGLDRTAVAKIETGSRKVSATELVALAEALERPIDWFFVESPESVVSRRTDPSVGGVSRSLDLKIESLARDIEALESDGILPGATESLLLAPPDDLEGAEQAARRVRARLDVGDGPLLELQRHVEDLGLLAFSLDLGRAGNDAAYVALDSAGVALINGSVDPGRRRFNLAHELGHHVFQDAYAPEVVVTSRTGGIEQLINAFAVHLLMPRSAIASLWSEMGTDDPRLAAVAVGARFRASWSAVCSQLRNLDLVDDGLRTALMSSPPTRADYLELGESWVEELIAPAIPPRYGQRVLAAYRAGKLTADRTLDLLHGTASREELPERAPIPVEALRREFDPLQ